jgi:hypothetical protein
MVNALPWDEPDWRPEVEDWMRAMLTKRGLSITGAIEQPHKRVWSTILKVPTEQGFVFFKAGSATQDFEPALLDLLADTRPNDVLPPLATEPSRGWSLLPDGGPTLREKLQGKLGLEEWTQLLSRYAQLQIASSEWAAKLTATGMPVRSLSSLPAEFEEITGDANLTLVKDEEDFLTPIQFEQLIKMRPDFEAMAAELSVSGIPQSLEHGDLHDGNVFATGRIYDWGDASLTFPFFTLIIVLRHAARTLEISEYADHPALLQLRDVYLREWSSFASFDRLLSTWQIAYRLGKFVRAIGWYEVVKKLPFGGNEYQGSISGWLQEGLLHQLS